MLFYITLKRMAKEIFLITYAKMFGYYKNIDILPVYNWFKLMEGQYKYLYKKQIKQTPKFFVRLYSELFFQFDVVEMRSFDDILKLAYLFSLYETTENPKFLNQANSLKYQMTNRKKTEPMKLNEMINRIEEQFDSIGKIDVHKMSTSRFFSLYYKAINKMKKHGVNK